MFSITTMASSTTKPVEIASAISERLSSAVVKQVHHAEGADNDSGTATLGMSVARTSRRKTNTTRTTRMMEMMSVS